MNTQQAELTVHEMLKEICDKIGYVPNYNYYEGGFKGYIHSIDWVQDSTYLPVNEREIIFTQEFMDKFENYVVDSKELGFDTYCEILKHLDNPTQFLFNLIK